MIMTFSIFMAVIFGILGLMIGSFLNVCVYRIPRGESVVIGRSHCPSCGHVLSAFDLFPVLSYFALGQRCRYCRAPISPRYAIVESLTALMYASASFALSMFGLHANWPVQWLFLILTLYLAVLSVFWTRHLMWNDRRQHGRSQAPSLNMPVAVALVVFFIQLALPFLIFI